MTRPDHWRLRTVDDLCLRVTSGGTPNRSNPEYYEPATVPWVKTGDLTDAYIRGYGERISEAGVRASSAKVLPPGTVLMAMYGATVGMLGMLIEEATCNQAACAMIANPDTCDPRWLFYALLNDRDFIVSQATGAAQQNLSGKTIRQFEYPTPPLYEQKTIVEVLGALDDKIAANTKLARTSLELAQVEFRQLLTTPTTEVALRDVLRLEYGKSLAAARRIDGDVDVFGSGGIVGTHNEPLLSGPGVIVGRKGTAGAVHWAPRDFFPIDTTYYVVPVDGDASLVFCLHLLKSLGLNEMNSDSAVPGLNREEALSTPVRMPGESDIRRFTAFAEHLFSLVDQVDRESRALITIRDALLPQLMSGKLHVKEAAELVTASI